MHEELEEQQELEERRRSPRYEHQGEVSVRQTVTGPHHNGALRDISMEGCLIQVDQRVKLHLADVVELKLRSSAWPVRLMGFVRHTSEDGHIAGLEFYRVGQRDFVNLSNFVADLQGSQTHASAVTDA